MDPTLAGFQSFITGVMKIPTTALSPSDPVVAFVYNLAIATVSHQLQCVPNADPTQPTLYAVAVYNLAGDLLINHAQDGTTSLFFKRLREELKIPSFQPGVMTSASDTGSSTSYDVPANLSNLTLDQLSNLRTPYGRLYLSIAQKIGGTWGVS